MSKPCQTFQGAPLRSRALGKVILPVQYWRLSVISPTNHDQLSLVHASTIAFASLAAVLCFLGFAILLACGELISHSPAAQGHSTRDFGARSLFYNSWYLSCVRIEDIRGQAHCDGVSGFLGTLNSCIHLINTATTSQPIQRDTPQRNRYVEGGTRAEQALYRAEDSRLRWPTRGWFRAGVRSRQTRH